MGAAAYKWITKDVVRKGKTYQWKYRVKDRSAETPKVAAAAQESSPGASAPTHHYVEKTITRNGKQHKQWFRKKGPPPEAAKPAPPPVAPKPAAPEPKPEPKPEAPKRAVEVLAQQPEATYKPPTNPAKAVEVLTKKLERGAGPKSQLDAPQVKAAKVAATAAHKSLDPAELKAFEAYTGGDFRILRALQHGRSPEDVQKEFSGVPLRNVQKLQGMLPALASAQQKMTVEDPTKERPLFRGMAVDSATLHKMLTHDTITHTSDTNSSSYHSGLSGTFAEKAYMPGGKTGGHAVVIQYSKVKRAASAMYAKNPMAGEQEMIIGKGSFRVKKRTYDPEMKRYHLEVEQIDE